MASARQDPTPPGSHRFWIRLPLIDRAPFAWLGATLIFALGILRAWHHEPWRDECGIWLFAQNSSSLSDLVHNLRYEGAPVFWPILTWLVGQVTGQILAVQILHLLLATAAAFLVLRYAPWPRWECVLCVLGYFFFWEYAIVCRAYVFALIGI